jgi:pimeloyl-ACP methyl ester carboxylesterase
MRRRRAIRSEELQNAVLAGHSYAGQVITGAVRHVRSRLRHVAYLDANVPLQDEAGIAAELANPLKTAAVERGNGWRILVPEQKNGTLMGVSNPAQIQWLVERLTDHSLATFEERVALDDDDPYPIPGSFVLCTARGRSISGPACNAGRVRKLGWPVTEIETGHDLMITEPAQTADFLMQSLAS